MEVLTGKYVSFKLEGKVYVTCVSSAVVYGSETWSMNAEQIEQFEWINMRGCDGCVSEG